MVIFELENLFRNAIQTGCIVNNYELGSLFENWSHGCVQQKEDSRRADDNIDLMGEDFVLKETGV
jgi:hypothetical protein